MHLQEQETQHINSDLALSSHSFTGQLTVHPHHSGAAKQGAFKHWVAGGSSSAKVDVGGTESLHFEPPHRAGRAQPFAAG